MSASIDSLRLDPQKLKENLAKAREEILKDAARIFILTAYGHVRVDTGMSRGSLVPLARYLNVFFPIGGNPRPDLGKTPETGAAKAKQNNFITSSSNSSSFEWWGEVFQYWLNEQFPLRSNDGKPWYSLLKGTIAAKDSLLKSKGQIARAIKASISYSTKVI